MALIRLVYASQFLATTSEEVMLVSEEVPLITQRFYEEATRSSASERL